ncbi:hypothetical protein [Providencia manganoxydans]|uniref:hypothetical protein n=1 Tax=Providencia manganoxydans TaxID=2923283 RepID=UPI0034E37DF6
MSNMNKAVQSVIELHELIENVFTGHKPDDLNKLLESFDSNFKMVTIGGDCIGLTQVNALFSNNIGAKPSLKITPDNIEPILEVGEYCWLQYRELHELDDSRLLRTSTVCIRIQDEQYFWTYLHETPIVKK